MMIKLGLIENPTSDRNRRSASGFAAQVAGYPDVIYARLDPFHALPEILQNFARQDVGLIAIAAGDGTVQAVLTALYEQGAYAEPPPLALLARGRTSLIPGDVGFMGGDSKALTKLMEISTAGVPDRYLVSRRLLRVDNIAGQTPQLGTFLGGAGIHRAIEACMANVHPTGLPPGLANFLTMTGLIGRWLVRGGESDAVFRGDEIGIGLDGQAPRTAFSLLILVTTLERLIFGTKPYWGASQGGLRYTRITYPPKKLVRALPRLLFGGPERSLPAENYESGSADHIRLEMTCPFMLDGQAFTPTPGQPVELSAADAARFVVA